MKRIFILLILWSSGQISLATDGVNSKGARAYSLANITSPLYDESSVFNNPAGIGFANNLSFGTFYNNHYLMKQLSTFGAGAIIPAKIGNLGVSLDRFGFSNFYESEIGLTYAKSYGDKIAFGVKINYLETYFGENYGSFKTFIGNFGIVSKMSEDLVFGAYIENPTRGRYSNSNLTRIPTTLRSGINYSFSESLNSFFEFEKTIQQKERLKGGLEFIAQNFFFLRAGVATNPATSSYGIGLKQKNLKIDIGLQYISIVGISSQASITYKFGRND